MRSLIISSWNIQGLYSSTFGFKGTNIDFLANMSDVDIIILLETWCKNDTDTHCPTHYREILLPSLKQKNIKHGRDSGGVIIWYKDDLSAYLTEIKRASTHIWLKLNKHIIDCENELYICAAYTPPIESPYYEDNFFEDLHHEIRHFQAQGNVVLIGDLNARTGTESDVIDSAGNKYIFKQTPIHTNTVTTQRNSPDHVLNRNGLT